MDSHRGGFFLARRTAGDSEWYTRQVQSNRLEEECEDGKETDRKDAKGVLIYPQVLKAGFIFGGSGGTGVLLGRDGKTGEWSNPAFYTMGSASFGLQIGGESAEVVLLVMSQKGMDSLLTSKFKLGGDASIALGPVGGGAKADVTTDFLSFAKSQGLYAGMNLDGSYIDVRENLNKAYYGKAVTPVDIVAKQSVSNKGADPLREALKKTK